MKLNITILLIHLVASAPSSALILQILESSSNSNNPETQEIDFYPLKKNPIDWAWYQNTLALVTGQPSNTQLQLAKFEGEKIRLADHPPIAGGNLPTFLAQDRIAYVLNDRKIIVARIKDNKLTTLNELNVPGQIGELQFLQGKLWIYAMIDDQGTTKPMMYYSKQPFDTTHMLGSGYYPRPIDDNEFIFVDQADGYSLRVRPFNASDDDESQFVTLIPQQVFFPQIIDERNFVVYQNGQDVASIEVANDNGQHIGILSKQGFAGKYPLRSPSGRLIAFCEYDPMEPQQLTIKVVTLDGKQNYKSQTNSQFVSNIFRWDFDSDRLAHLKHSDDGTVGIVIVDLKSR